VYLGADTPVESVADAARACDPELVVISAVEPRTFRRHRAELAALAVGHRVCLGGAGAASASVDDDVATLEGGPVEEAERLTELVRAGATA